MGFDCSGGISFLSREDFFNKPKTIVHASDSQSLTDIITLLIKFLGDANEAIAVAEIVIDSQTI